jgi:3-hydroxyisobutyryl-CoA hydrolase
MTLPAASPPAHTAAACLAVSAAGTIALDPLQSALVLEQPPPAHARLRTLVLNRQASLNALNKEMLDALYNRVLALNDASSVDAILLTAVPGRAFCAGGDIRSLYMAVDAGGDVSLCSQYFAREYQLNHLMGAMPTILISLLDGIVMGGGAGITMHGRFRIATENTIFSMPECAIGLHPDAGMCHVLSRLPGGVGTYLALTGAQLHGSDVFAAGLATHYVPSHVLPALIARLPTINLTSPGVVSRAIADFSLDTSVPALANRELMDECFGAGDVAVSDLTVGEILNRLRVVVKRSPEGGAGAKFAEDALSLILKGCPTSVKVSFEAIKRSKTFKSLGDTVRMDYRLAVRETRKQNFMNGVRSAVVTKDRNPSWMPATLDEVSDADVQALFEPLSSDLGMSELELILDDRDDKHDVKTAQVARSRM